MVSIPTWGWITSIWWFKACLLPLVLLSLERWQMNSPGGQIILPTWYSSLGQVLFKQGMYAIYNHKYFLKRYIHTNFSFLSIEVMRVRYAVEIYWWKLFLLALILIFVYYVVIKRIQTWWNIIFVIFLQHSL